MNVSSKNGTSERMKKKGESHFFLARTILKTNEYYSEFWEPYVDVQGKVQGKTTMNTTS